jgi:hypothetical protein
LTVFIKNIEKQKVIYIVNKDSPAAQKEIAFENLHKIVWRTGKEYVIDNDFDLKAQNPKPEEQLNISKEQIKGSLKTISSESSIKTEKIKSEQIVYPLIEKDTLPTAPSLIRKEWLLYYVYKVNGKRVKAQQLIDVVARKYDSECYRMISSGYQVQKNHYRNQVIGASLGLIALPFSLLSQELGSLIGLPAFIYTAIEGQKSWNGSKEVKEGIKLYEAKRLSKKLKPPLTIPF